jgi:hypothetical protein
MSFPPQECDNGMNVSSSSEPIGSIAVGSADRVSESVVASLRPGVPPPPSSSLLAVATSGPGMSSFDEPSQSLPPPPTMQGDMKNMDTNWVYQQQQQQQHHQPHQPHQPHQQYQPPHVHMRPMSVATAIVVGDVASASASASASTSTSASAAAASSSPAAVAATSVAANRDKLDAQGSDSCFIGSFPAAMAVPAPVECGDIGRNKKHACNIHAGYKTALQVRHIRAVFVPAAKRSRHKNRSVSMYSRRGHHAVDVRELDVGVYTRHELEKLLPENKTYMSRKERPLRDCIVLACPTLALSDQDAWLENYLAEDSSYRPVHGMVIRRSGRMRSFFADPDSIEWGKANIENMTTEDARRVHANRHLAAAAVVVVAPGPANSDVVMAATSTAATTSTDPVVAGASAQAASSLSLLSQRSGSDATATSSSAQNELPVAMTLVSVYDSKGATANGASESSGILHTMSTAVGSFNNQRAPSGTDTCLRGVVPRMCLAEPDVDPCSDTHGKKHACTAHAKKKVQFRVVGVTAVLVSAEARRKALETAEKSSRTRSAMFAGKYGLERLRELDVGLMSRKELVELRARRRAEKEASAQAQPQAQPQVQPQPHESPTTVLGDAPPMPQDQSDEAMSLPVVATTPGSIAVAASSTADMVTTTTDASATMTADSTTNVPHPPPPTNSLGTANTSYGPAVAPSRVAAASRTRRVPFAKPSPAPVRDCVLLCDPRMQSDAQRAWLANALAIFPDAHVVSSFDIARSARDHKFYVVEDSFGQ